MRYDVHQLIANFICLPFGARQVVYNVLKPSLFVETKIMS